MELAKRIGLEDEVLSSDYESYMDYILKPSGLTLQDLREHPQGMKGKVLIPPRIQTYREEPFHTTSGKIELYSLALDKYRESRGYEPLPVYHDFRDQRDVDREMYPLILSTGQESRSFSMPDCTGCRGCLPWRRIRRWRFIRRMQGSMG